MGWGWNSFAVKIEKKLLYDKHTLQDTINTGSRRGVFNGIKFRCFWIRWRLFRKGMTGTGCCGTTRMQTGSPSHEKVRDQ